MDLGGLVRRLVGRPGQGAGSPGSGAPVASRASASAASAGASVRPAVPAWRSAAPMPRAVPPPRLVGQRTPFEPGLGGGNAAPTALQPLGHASSLEAPAGLVSAVASSAQRTPSGDVPPPVRHDHGQPGEPAAEPGPIWPGSAEASAAAVPASPGPGVAAATASPPALADPAGPSTPATAARSVAQTSGAGPGRQVAANGPVPRPKSSARIQRSTDLVQAPPTASPPAGAVGPAQASATVARPSVPAPEPAASDPTGQAEPAGPTAFRRIQMPLTPRGSDAAGDAARRVGAAEPVAARSSMPHPSALPPSPDAGAQRSAAAPSPAPARRLRIGPALSEGGRGPSAAQRSVAGEAASTASRASAGSRTAEAALPPPATRSTGAQRDADHDHPGEAADPSPATETGSAAAQLARDGSAAGAPPRTGPGASRDRVAARWAAPRRAQLTPVGGSAASTAGSAGGGVSVARAATGSASASGSGGTGSAGRLGGPTVARSASGPSTTTTGGTTPASIGASRSPAGPEATPSSRSGSINAGPASYGHDVDPVAARSIGATRPTAAGSSSHPGGGDRPPTTAARSATRTGSATPTGSDTPTATRSGRSAQRQGGLRLGAALPSVRPQAGSGFAVAQTAGDGDDADPVAAAVSSVVAGLASDAAAPAQRSPAGDPSFATSSTASSDPRSPGGWMSAQRAEGDGAGSVAPAGDASARGGPTEPELDALAIRLFDRLHGRLRRELLVERERAGAHIDFGR